MRDLINIVTGYLAEARAPQDPINRPKTSTALKDDPLANFEPEDPWAVKPEQPLARANQQQATARFAGSTSHSAQDVSMRAHLPPEASSMMHDFLSRQHAADDISDEQAAARAGIAAGHAHGNAVPNQTPSAPTTAENLPMVIAHELTTRNHQQYPDDWQPHWTMVKHLPGYLQNAIRSMGRAVFGQFTNTPIENIQVMASPMINSDTDLNRMAAFIKTNGIKDDQAVVDFMQNIPNYQAEVALYKLANYEFLLVRDFAGHYIYGWPGGRGVHITAPAAHARLK
jgi:hypothetical protein